MRGGGLLSAQLSRPAPVIKYVADFFHGRLRGQWLPPSNHHRALRRAKVSPGLTRALAAAIADYSADLPLIPRVCVPPLAKVEAESVGGSNATPRRSSRPRVTPDGAIFFPVPGPIYILRQPFFRVLGSRNARDEQGMDIHAATSETASGRTLNRGREAPGMTSREPSGWLPTPPVDLLQFETGLPRLSSRPPPFGGPGLRRAPRIARGNGGRR